MKKLLKYILLFLILFIIGNARIFSNKSNFLDVSGYYKCFFTGFKNSPVKMGETELKDPMLGTVNNRVRLKMLFSLSKWLSLETAYDFSPRIQDPNLFHETSFIGNIDPFAYRVTDFSDRLYPSKGKEVRSFGIFHNLDRCFFTIKTSVADIFIGRQAISWGSGHFINPTDVIAPFTFNELDTEERRGVDALRIRIPLGMMDELDIGYIIGKSFKFENSAFYIRGKLYLFKTDFALLLMGFRENLLLGFDITRSVGRAGAWFEAAVVDPDFFVRHEEHSYGNNIYSETYFRASLGLDYSFTGKLYGFFEYHFNSAGKLDPADYHQVFLSTAYAEGASYLLGKHYLNLGFTFQITPLTPFTGLAFINLNDGSVTFSPSLDFNIAENIYLSAGAYIGIGESMELIPDPWDSSNSVIKFHSEFGVYPTLFYTSFRVYF